MQRNMLSKDKIQIIKKPYSVTIYGLTVCTKYFDNFEDAANYALSKRNIPDTGLDVEIKVLRDGEYTSFLRKNPFY